MKKILHIAKANALRHKGASLSLFFIIAIVSALAVIAGSVLSEVERNYWAGVEHLHGMHSMFLIPRDKMKASYIETIQEDPRVSEIEQHEVLFARDAKVNYGGDTELSLIIGNIDKSGMISTPRITLQDETVSTDTAIYLPNHAQNLGYHLGDLFRVTYMNRELLFTVAGFFETTSLSLPNLGTIALYVPQERYEQLTRYMSRSIMLRVRLHEPQNATQFNRELNEQIDLDFTVFGSDTLFWDVEYDSIGTLLSVMVLSAIILIFALILIVISLLVIHFRIVNSIENTMHEIGVLKAQGYTSRQIIACYLSEYGFIALTAATLGAVAAIPVFHTVRQLVATMNGFPWTFGANPSAGILSVLIIFFILLTMVLQSTRRIKNLPPVIALRGGMATNNFRRNFFPLKQFSGSVHLGLGLKNMFAFFKFYAMIGIVIAGVSLAITFVTALYQNLVIDQSVFIKIMGLEISDVSVTVTRHTDADALAARLEEIPEVRKTSMMDILSFTIDGMDIVGYASNDFTQYETFVASEGRMPLYHNEIAMPRRLALQLDKEVGDSVKVMANGVSQEYIITGSYSTLMNGGQVATMTLEGYQRLDPNYIRRSINIYLNDGITFDQFSEILKQQFGVLNIYDISEDDPFANAKARAEEKISAYMEEYGIDSVSYAVIYHDEIIISGSSDEYQIEKITDYGEFLHTAVNTFAAPMPIITQLIVIVSLIVVSLILSMTVRSIVAKRRRELGTLKANGFTTKQLARQMAISFMPMTAIGVLIGCISGALSINPVLGTALASAGAQDTTFHISPVMVAGISIAMLLVTYLIAHISAIRIRHVSVYELLSE